MEYLTPKTFKCTKCGECCRPIVQVDEKDIQRIEQTGRKREDFVVHDEQLQKNTLKQHQKVCIFLKWEGEEFVCSLYEHRPEVCRKYPFITGKEKLKDCRPARWEYWMPLKEILE